jgi:hypothetical protein
MPDFAVSASCRHARVSASVATTPMHDRLDTAFREGSSRYFNYSTSLIASYILLSGDALLIGFGDYTPAAGDGARFYS